MRLALQLPPNRNLPNQEEKTRLGGRQGESPLIILTIPLNSSPYLVLEKVKCFNRLVNAVIDTGAVVSVISPKFCRALDLERDKWEGPHIVLADDLRV